LISASGDTWRSFMLYSEWAHEKCAGVDPLIDEVFICDSRPP
jgi:hypothetical protein